MSSTLTAVDLDTIERGDHVLGFEQMPLFA